MTIEIPRGKEGIELEKPDLENMWEIFVRIPFEMSIPNLGHLYDMIRFKLSPMIHTLTQNEPTRYYSFLIHNRDSGVPTTADDNSLYFHVRISFRNASKVDVEEVNKMLPDYCAKTLTRKCEDIRSISGIDKSLVKNEDITEVWRVIGEQSRCILGILNVFKENVEMPFSQVAQFLHYFSNMTQLAIR